MHCEQFHASCFVRAVNAAQRKSCLTPLELVAVQVTRDGRRTFPDAIQACAGRAGATQVAYRAGRITRGSHTTRVA